MYDLDARRWVPKPKSRYRVEKVFKTSDLAFEGITGTDSIDVGDIVSFKIRDLDPANYIAISFLFDSSSTPVWDSSWTAYLERDGHKKKIGTVPYTTLARLFSDIPSIKFNWDKSFAPFTETTLEEEDCWQYERAMEHFFPNFLVKEI